MVTITNVRTAKVDPCLADEVAATFAAARTTRRDPTVCAAYRQLAHQSDQLFMGVHGVRVVFTRCLMPYASDREMVAAVRAERLLEVTTAAFGTVNECVKSLTRFIDAGADEIATYGSTRAQNGRLVTAWRERA